MQVRERACNEYRYVGFLVIKLTGPTPGALLAFFQEGRESAQCFASLRLPHNGQAVVEIEPQETSTFNRPLQACTEIHKVL